MDEPLLTLSVEERIEIIRQADRAIWRMAKPCADCPFSKSEGGIRQAKALRPGRLASIKRELLRGAAFTCHKTTHETGNGTNLMCAGAIDYQNSRGASSNLQRVMESLDYFAEKRASVP
jgi:hypothetical protein